MKKFFWVVLLFIILIPNISNSKNITNNEEIKIIKNKMKNFYTNQGIKLEKSDKETLIKNTEKNVEKAYELLNDDLDRKYIFSNAKDLTTGEHLRTSLLQINNMLKGYVIEDNKYYNNEKLKNDIIEALYTFYEKGYHEDVIEKGNWWHWEIGIPKTLNEVLIIGDEILPIDLKKDLINASKFFQPYPEYSGAGKTAKYSSSPEKRLSTGANRLDTALISFGRGIISEDDIEIRNSINSIYEVFKLVEKGDGLYKDGSIIQHNNVPYNGTYGQVIYSGLSLFIYFASNTSYEIDSNKIKVAYDTFINGYPHLLINGGLNDSVNGRSISRDNNTELDKGIGLIQFMALISEGSEKEYKDKINSIIKKSLLENNYNNPLDKVTNYVRKDLLKNILKDDNIKKVNIDNVKIYNNMDRAVAILNDDGKIVISMNSNRIANYETMNNENLKGYYTGDGMTYIYGLDSSSFVNYWPLVDPLKIPGVTNSLNLLKDKEGDRRLNPSNKTFVGGASNGKYAIVAMDYNSYNEKTFAKKTWLFLENMMIALGSNITSVDENIITTIDNRILNMEDFQEIYVNNEKLISEAKISKKGDKITFHNKKLDENIAYILLEDLDVSAKIEKREGSWKAIGGKDKNIFSKNFLEIYINHRINPVDQTYSYIVMPMYKKETMKNIDLEDIKIVRRDDKAHIIKITSKNMYAFNIFTDDELIIDDIKVKGTSSLIILDKDDEIEIIASNPSHIKSNLVIEISNKKYEIPLLEDGSSKIFNIKK